MDYRFEIINKETGQLALYLATAFAVNGPGTVFDPDRGEEVSLFGGEMMYVSHITATPGAARKSLVIHGTITDSDAATEVDFAATMTFDQACLLLAGFPAQMAEIGSAVNIHSALTKGTKSNREKAKAKEKAKSADPVWGSW